MKLAVIQPCFFPYEGYFNIIKEADKVIFLDDVFFNSKDWINKTILNIQDKDYYFRIPLTKTDNPVLIKDAACLNASWRKKFIKVLNFNYRFKKNFNKVMPMIKEVFEIPGENMSQLSAYGIFKTAELLKILPRYAFTFSSVKYPEINTYLEDKIIEICKKEKASEFLALPYMRGTLDPSSFLKHNIRLTFISSNYPKFSIIDKLMDMDM